MPKAGEIINNVLYYRENFWSFPLSNTVDKAFALGLKPQPNFAVLHESDTDLHLTYDLGDIDPSEVSIRHNLDTVTLEIRPTCKGFVIENPLFMAGMNHDEDPALDAFLTRFCDLKWATCSAQELFEFFADYLISVRRVRDEFLEAPLAMIKPLVMEMCFRRDAHGLSLNAESFRAAVPLDAYSTLCNEAESALPNDAQAALRKYLAGYTRVSGDNGDWSAKSYEHHGYCAMLITEVLMTGWDGGGHRAYRLANADISHAIDRPIFGFKTDIYRGKVSVELKFHA